MQGAQMCKCFIDEETQRALSDLGLNFRARQDNSHSFNRNFRFMEVASANDVLKVF